MPKDDPVTLSRGKSAAKKTPATASKSGVEIRFEQTYGEANRAILKGLRAYNDGFLGKKRRAKPLAITLRENGVIVGGLIGETFPNYLFVKLLWIDDSHRGGGNGTKLLQLAEDEAKKRGAVGVVLDTMSFQAPDFYRKLGFREFGRLENFPVAGRTQHWLTKTL